MAQSVSRNFDPFIYLRQPTATTSKLFANLVEKDATRETGGLIAKLKTGPECDVYRRRLAEAGQGVAL